EDKEPDTEKMVEIRGRRMKMGKRAEGIGRTYSAKMADDQSDVLKQVVDLLRQLIDLKGLIALEQQERVKAFETAFSERQVVQALEQALEKL
ncbi:MAG: hypothetical protein AAB295_07515, partial [Chloroflexota bacterium]